MEKWEHLVVSVRPVVDGREFVLSPKPPGIEDRTNLSQVDRDHTVALLDVLGDDGWQLVSVDVQTDTYWLKRVVDPSRPSPLRW
ncbi:MAG: hypothetical protein HOV66_30560 [Streptomycetaceae bacterium]|nr:hypothetical protein [Streptomycetaceae bacterium]